MAVKIRLTRLGKKKQPTYRVVVTDSRKARDGKYIEQLGFYDPRQDPSVVDIDNDRALHWLTTGAQPTERAQKLLEISGAWTQFKVARGEIHTIGSDDAPVAPRKSKAAAAKAPAATTAEPVVAPVDDASDAVADAESPDAVEGATEPDAAADAGETS